VDKVVANAVRCEGPAFVAYTLVNAGLRQYMHKRLADHGITFLDLFSTPLYVLSDFLGSQPAENPNEFHGVNDLYYKRMEAVEFTLQHDDGKRVAGLAAADIVLVGVSRVGKTPLSMYLSFYGYKVVNVPLARGVEPPPELETIDQGKIVGLTIDPDHLVEIRKKRMDNLQAPASTYSNPGMVLDEIEYVNEFFRRHRRWPVINVTNRSIEETAVLVRDRIFGHYRRVN